MNNSAAKTTETPGEPAANKKKKRDDSPERQEIFADSRAVRFAFVPIVREFRAHTKRNEARLWIPVETSLLVRYEFASCSLQTRYVFVAIVLYCGANGLDEIPLDAKFMSSVLVADERTVQKSFDELLVKNLLVEREKREKKEEKKRQTDRPDAPDGGAVRVEFENLFQESAESEKPPLAEQKKSPLAEQEKSKADGALLKTVSPNDKDGGKRSMYSIEECLKYVEHCQSKGETVNSPKALANHLHKTGDADAFIMAALYPAKQEELDREQYGAPVKFTDEPCRVCFGAKMADLGGKGFRACEHCKNERGKSTGFEPQGESSE